MAYQKLTPIIATGATEPRYLGDRCADIVNVKDFGAVGDGVTDDASAFSAAATAANGDPVFVPVGTYKLDSDVSGVFYSFGEVAVAGAGSIAVVNILDEIQAKVELDGSNSSSIGGVLATYMAHAAMPSGNYETISAPASGGSVTAPADGWLFAYGKQSSTSIGIITLEATGYACSSTTAWQNGYTNITVPVAKDAQVKVNYTNISDMHLRFIYSNGSYSV